MLEKQTHELDGIATTGTAPGIKDTGPDASRDLASQVERIGIIARDAGLMPT